jgi:hypothetical protein
MQEYFFVPASFEYSGCIYIKVRSRLLYAAYGNQGF